MSDEEQRDAAEQVGERHEHPSVPPAVERSVQRMERDVAHGAVRHAKGSEPRAVEQVQATHTVQDQIEAMRHGPPGRPRSPGAWIAATVALLALLAASMGWHHAEQRRDERWRDARQLTGGDPALGAALIRHHGCAGCHTIPGIPGADGLVGPPLAGIASRNDIGGVLVNDPQHMMQWIVNPKAWSPRTAMPAVGVTQEQARDIAAYLYTLR
jgi:cytochrome c2